MEVFSRAMLEMFIQAGVKGGKEGLSIPNSPLSLKHISSDRWIYYYIRKLLSYTLERTIIHYGFKIP